MSHFLQAVKLSIIIITILFAFRIDCSIAQTTSYPIYYHVISLKNDTIQLENKDFYISKVVDCRTDTTNIGTIKEGLFDTKYAAKLDTNLSISLKKYFDEILPVKAEYTPVIVKITHFDISEKADATTEHGKTEIQMEFYTQKNNTYSKIFETKQLTTYSYSDVTKLHEKYIRETLKKCIRALSNSISTTVNAGNISYEQLIMKPYIDSSKIEYINFKEKAYYSKINLTVSGGFGSFMQNMPQDLPKELRTYVKGTKYAYNYATDFSFFFHNNFGIGFNYANYDSKNSIDYFRLYDEDNNVIAEGNIADNINVKRFGPSIHYRTLIMGSNVFLKYTLAYNRLHYVDNSVLFDKNYLIDMNTSSILGKFDIDYYVFKNIALNFSVSVWCAKNKSFEVNGVPTDLTEKSYMLRSDANVGITLCY